MSTVLLIAIYGILIVGSSIAGGYLPTMFRLTHLRMQILLSLVGGFMLGIALLHLLPHSVAISDSVAIYGSLDFSVVFVLIGLLLTFFLMRVFHFHQHGTEDQGDLPAGNVATAAVGDSTARNHEHEHTHGHDHAEAHGCGHHGGEKHHGGVGRDSGVSLRFNWMGVAFGLGLHTLVDGVALGAAIVADEKHDASVFFKGFGVFLAIFLHKPLDAISICSLMRIGRWSEKTIQSTNVLLALLCPAGALLVAFGVGQWSMLNTVGAEVALVVLLAMSAGVFLCISLSDLLPELQFHRHHRLQLSAALLFGLLAAYGIKYLEPAHAHPSGSTHVHSEPHEFHQHD